MGDLRSRFPGVTDGFARFDGPAGTLMVDTAIEAMRQQMSDGSNANLGGPFAAARATDELVADAREVVGRFLGAPPASVAFGANMTTLTFAFTRAISRTWGDGDQIVCTRLDHDANVTPWVQAARDRGAEVVFAPLDASTGRLHLEDVAACLTDRTCWVAVTAASNLIGTIPDVAAITKAAHAAGARVYVDAVHLAPHRPIDFAAIGCDALVCSPYKWYGPHSGVLLLSDEIIDTVEPYKVRPAPDAGIRRWETGTPAFESIAGIAAAARFMADEHGGEHDVFAHLLDGLHSMPGVTVVGPQDLVDRTPTALFNVRGRDATDVAAHLAAHDVAVWAGHSYAVEAAGVVGTGVRAGVVRYVNDEDVQQLLRAIDAIAT